MITINRGDIFRSTCEAWVNPVNCRGTMGRGLALDFKKLFPRMYRKYRRDCLDFRLRPGTAYLYSPDSETPRVPRTTGPRWIICATTKDYWQDPSSYEWVQGCLQELRRIIDEADIRSVALPALGCGLGGLAWPRVEQMIREEFQADQDLDLQLYPPPPLWLPGATGIPVQ